MHEWWLIDGRETRDLPADDRGLALADGAFETLRLEEGRTPLLDYHRDRLVASLSALLFEHPEQTVDDAFGAVLPWALGHRVNASLRLTITRGSGPRGYRPPDQEKPRVIARLVAGLPALQRPADLTVAPVAWPDQPSFRGCKLLMRAEQVLAARTAQTLGVDDSLMTDGRGHIISTSSANVFIRLGSGLLTPRLDRAGIAGTRRRWLMMLAPSLGFAVREADVTFEALAAADEVFFCNTLVGIRSVGTVQHDDRRYQYASTVAAEALCPYIHGGLP